MNPLNRSSKFFVLFLFFLGIVSPLLATKTVSKEYFLNGRIKAITIVVITMPRNIDLFNFYKKTKVSRTEFDSLTSRKVRETVRITKLGHGGKPCYEIYFKQIDYDENGKRTRFQEFTCDKKKTKVKEYSDGEVIHVRIQKRRRLPW
jgi:hypothetical protein